MIDTERKELTEFIREAFPNVNPDWLTPQGLEDMAVLKRESGDDPVKAAELFHSRRPVAKTHVIVCLSGLSVHTNGSPIFGCKVYGPFTEEEAENETPMIRRLEGGITLVRPLVDLADTYRRLSAD